jgi:hypothetical protein
MGRKKKSETINQASETNTSTEEKKQLYLVYIKPIGVDSNEWYEYDFYFSKTPETFWCEGFDCDFADQTDILPEDGTFDEVKRLRTMIPLFCMQHNKCFSMSHVISGVLCVAFEDISDYDEYPEPFRLVLKYGMGYSEVEAKLAERHQLFSEN